MSDRPRALVAEDDAGIRVLMTRILMRGGFDVDAVEDGAAAIDCIVHTDYAVIVLDLMMPRIAGFNVLEDLSRRRPDLVKRVIVTTASGSSEIDRIRPLVNCCIEKPFDISALVQKARAMMASLTPQTIEVQPSSAALPAPATPPVDDEAIAEQQARPLLP